MVIVSLYFSQYSICLYKNKVFVNESELLDVWYDINFLGQAIDSCFYPLYEDLHFHRYKLSVRNNNQLLEGEKSTGVTF